MSPMSDALPDGSNKERTTPATAGNFFAEDCQLSVVKSLEIAG